MDSAATVDPYLQSIAPWPLDLANGPVSDHVPPLALGEVALLMNSLLLYFSGMVWQQSGQQEC